MFGNKRTIIFFVILFAFSSILFAGNRIPAKNFRFGLNIEGGVKFIGPVMFHGKTGIILKFNETFSLIPYVGIYPDEQVYENEYWNGHYYETDTEKDEDVTIDAGLTLRFEFPREIIRKSTAYEYDVEEQKFQHHYYYSPFRPFLQLHIGTFLGGGGGFLYYFTGTLSMGLNVDVGYNLAAEEGFGVSPKLVIATSF